jgi:sugar phosphate isomerase/epimerase
MMPISLGVRLTGEMRRMNVDGVVSFAREAGLDALDLPSDFASWTAPCREGGLRVGSVDGVGAGDLISPDDAVRERAVAAISAQAVEMAKADLQVMFLCLVPRDNNQSISRSLDVFRDSFPAVAAACEASGVRVAFEGWPGPSPHLHTLGYTPEVWRAMFSAVPSPALGLCFDPSHLIRLGIDYSRVLEEFGDRIHHCHGKDTALLPEPYYLYGHMGPALSSPPKYSGGSWRYCIPGTGLADWAAIAEALERRGYKGCVCIELEDSRYADSAENEQRGVRKALAHLAEHFR